MAFCQSYFFLSSFLLSLGHPASSVSKKKTTLKYLSLTAAALSWQFTRVLIPVSHQHTPGEWLLAAFFLFFDFLTGIWGRGIEGKKTMLKKMLTVLFYWILSTLWKGWLKQASHFSNLKGIAKKKKRKVPFIDHLLTLILYLSKPVWLFFLL